jgi:hypothetical protein
VFRVSLPGQGGPCGAAGRRAQWPLGTARGACGWRRSPRAPAARGTAPDHESNTERAKCPRRTGRSRGQPNGITLRARLRTTCRPADPPRAITPCQGGGNRGTVAGSEGRAPLTRRDRATPGRRDGRKPLLVAEGHTTDEHRRFSPRHSCFCVVVRHVIHDHVRVIDLLQRKSLRPRAVCPVSGPSCSAATAAVPAPGHRRTAVSRSSASSAPHNSSAPRSRPPPHPAAQSTTQSSRPAQRSAREAPHATLSSRPDTAKIITFPPSNHAPPAHRCAGT